MPGRSKPRLSRLRSVLRRARWARKTFVRAPRMVRIAGGAAMLLAVLVLVNIAYQTMRKPTELFVLVGHALDKEPSETWRQYGPLFRKHATATITPELLGALAQVETSGNPLARTYWRWRWSFNPLAIYRPASSAVGLFQMLDAAMPTPRGSAFAATQSRRPAAARPFSMFARSRATPSSWHRSIWIAMSPMFSLARAM
jgi:hypothetical protein